MTELARPTTARAVRLGLGAGLRSFTPLAAVALTFDDARVTRGWRRWPVLRSRAGRALVIALAGSELVGDKLPAAPSRLRPGALVGRLGLAALAGAAIGSERDRAAARKGAITAAAAALAASVGGYYGRRAVVERTGLPDPVIALVGDALAVALSRSGAKG